jgi:hypothetical protein
MKPGASRVPGTVSQDANSRLRRFEPAMYTHFVTGMSHNQSALSARGWKQYGFTNHSLERLVRKTRILNPIACVNKLKGYSVSGICRLRVMMSDMLSELTRV